MYDKKDVFTDVKFREYGDIKKDIERKLNVLSDNEVAFFSNDEISTESTFRMYISIFKNKHKLKLVTKKMNEGFYVKKFA